jgi:hypothetical protein
MVDRNLNDHIFPIIMSFVICVLFTFLGNFMVHVLDCSTIGNDTTEQAYFQFHHFSITDGQQKCAQMEKQISDLILPFGLIAGGSYYFVWLWIGTSDTKAPKEGKSRFNLFKIGLGLIACVPISLFIINVGNFLDADAKIGASIITGSIFLGLSFPCIIRGKQIQRYENK